MWVSTDTQASEGMFLDALRSAIANYCAMQGIKLVKLCQDVMSGGKEVGTFERDFGCMVRALIAWSVNDSAMKRGRLLQTVSDLCEGKVYFEMRGPMNRAHVRDSVLLYKGVRLVREASTPSEWVARNLGSMGMTYAHSRVQGFIPCCRS